MHKVVFLTFLLQIGLSGNAQVNSIGQIRDLYFAHNEESCSAMKLMDKLGNTNQDSDALIMAYYGAASAAAPVCVSNPAKKLSLFNQGKKFLDGAASKKPSSFEVRFLRFATQVKAPGFLGYRNNISSDKQFLIRNLDSGKKEFADSKHFKTAIKFIIDSEALDQSEQKTVIAYLQSL